MRKLRVPLLLALLLLAPFAAAAPGGGKGRDRDGSLAMATSSATAESATLVVLVNTTGGDGSFTFQTRGGEGLPPSFGLATRNGTGRLAFAGLRADHAYGLDQALPEGWRLASASCGGASPANFTIPANGTLTCVFEDVRLATLRVVVNATGGDLALPFLANGSPELPSTFAVNATNGTGAATFRFAGGDNLSLVPVVPHGWTLAHAACTTGEPANLTLPAGEDATCAFHLLRANAIQVRVEARGGDATFPFLTNGAGGLPALFNLTTAGGAARVAFTDVEPNVTYSLAPVVPAGWRLASASCGAQDPGALVLAPGDAADCVFRLDRLARLHVVLASRGGDASFPFGASGPSLPATFTLATTNGTGGATYDLQPDATHALLPTAPAGWRVAASGCTPGAPGNLTPEPGAEITCRFDFSRLSELRGRAWHDRDRDGAQEAGEEGLAGWTAWLDRDGDGLLDAGEPLTATNATGHYAFADLAPGVHVARLAPVAGWSFVAPVSGAHAVSLPEAVLVDGLDFAMAVPDSAPPATPPTSPPAPGGEPAGKGFWKNWDRHRTYAKADLDAWVRAASNASAWLMPAGFTEDAEGAADLLDASSKSCNRTYGHQGCARKKLEGSYLVLRLNLASGRLAWDASARLPAQSEAATLLGLGADATLRQLVDALEAKAGASLTRDQAQTLRSAIERAGHGS